MKKKAVISEASIVVLFFLLFFLYRSVLHRDTVHPLLYRPLSFFSFAALRSFSPGRW